MDRLKDDGDRATHDLRPVVKIADFRAMIVDEDDDNNRAVDQLIETMRHFNMVGTDDAIKTDSPW